MLNYRNPFVRFGKLFKYEILSTGRFFLPIYAAIILMSILGHITDNFDFAGNDINGIALFIYTGLCIALCVLHIIVLIQRFKKNLLGNEAYLSLALPVGISNHIWTKAISSFIWIVLSILIGSISIQILSGEKGFLLSVLDFPNKILSYLTLEFGGLTPSQHSSYTLACWLFVIVTILSSIMMIFALLSFGHLLKKFGKVILIITFIVLSNIESNVLGLVVRNHSTVQDILNWIWIYTGISFLFGTLYYLVTYFILTKHLNLE